MMFFFMKSMLLCFTGCFMVFVQMLSVEWGDVRDGSKITVGKATMHIV